MTAPDPFAHGGRAGADDDLAEWEPVDVRDQFSRLAWKGRADRLGTVLRSAAAVLAQTKTELAASMKAVDPDHILQLADALGGARDELEVLRTLAETAMRQALSALAAGAA